MKRSARRVGVLLTFALLTLLVAGCGDDDRETSDSSQSTAPDIKLGLLYSVGGPTSAQFAPILQGVKARIGLENDNGGVNGSKLVLVEGDDQSNPAQNLAAARDLVENKGVFGIIEASPVGGS